MSFDQNESVERTLDEILAELDLLPSPKVRETSVSETPVPGISVSETSAPKAPVSDAPAAAPAEETVSTGETVPPQPKKEPESHRPVAVSVTTEQARPASPDVEKISAASVEESEEAADEPATVVFSPSRLREQMRAVAVSSAQPASQSKQAPPSSASLKAELEQRSRLGAGHTLTEQLRAQDPVRSASMPKRRHQAAPKAAPVQRDARPEPKKKSRKKLFGWKKEAVEWIKALVGAALVVFVLFFVLTRVVSVEGASMEPTLLAGDRLLISRVFYTPENGDIVVTSKNNALGKPLVKRIIAKGGQIVDMDEDGRLMINGLALDEYYLSSPETDMGDLELPLTVPDDCVFIVGDNRAHSTDSRSDTIGMVPEKELEGRVLFRFWPPYRLGTVK